VTYFFIFVFISYILYTSKNQWHWHIDIEQFAYWHRKLNLWRNDDCKISTKDDDHISDSSTTRYVYLLSYDCASDTASLLIKISTIKKPIVIKAWYNKYKYFLNFDLKMWRSLFIKTKLFNIQFEWFSIFYKIVKTNILKFIF
jgi:hypothetical protein